MSSEPSAATSPCPGCAVELPTTRAVARPARLVASAACWEVDGEITARVLARPRELAVWHQTAVDAYAAQHAGPDTPAITVFFSLCTLHLVLEEGLTGLQGRDAHGHLARTHDRAAWPRFEAPSSRGAVTVLDVALADDLAGAIRSWGEAVWHAWAPTHDEVRRTTRRLLGDWRPRRP